MRVVWKAKQTALISADETAAYWVASTVLMTEISSVAQSGLLWGDPWVGRWASYLVLRKAAWWAGQMETG